MLTMKLITLFLTVLVPHLRSKENNITESDTDTYDWILFKTFTKAMFDITINIPTTNLIIVYDQHLGINLDSRLPCVPQLNFFFNFLDADSLLFLLETFQADITLQHFNITNLDVQQLYYETIDNLIYKSDSIISLFLCKETIFEHILIQVRKLEIT